MIHLDPERREDRCLECQSHVTPQFRRGYGDADDRAHRCLECDSITRISEGSAAGKAVGHVDPLDDPSRFNDSREDLPDTVLASIAGRSVVADGGVE